MPVLPATIAEPNQTFPSYYFEMTEVVKNYHSNFERRKKPKAIWLQSNVNLDVFFNGTHVSTARNAIINIMMNHAELFLVVATDDDERESGLFGIVRVRILRAARELHELRFGRELQLVQSQRSMFASNGVERRQLFARTDVEERVLLRLSRL